MDGLEHHHAPLRRRRRRRRFPCYLVGALVVAVVVKPVEHLRRGHKFPSADRIENELLRNSESLLVGLDPRRRRRRFRGSYLLVALVVAAVAKPVEDLHASSTSSPAQIGLKLSCWEIWDLCLKMKNRCEELQRTCFGVTGVVVPARPRDSLNFKASSLMRTRSGRLVVRGFSFSSICFTSFRVNRKDLFALKLLADPWSILLRPAAVPWIAGGSERSEIVEKGGRARPGMVFGDVTSSGWQTLCALEEELLGTVCANKCEQPWLSDPFDRQITSQATISKQCILPQTRTLR